MLFLEINEIWLWCEEHQISLEDRARPADDESLTHRGRWLYGDGGRSGREASVAADCLRALGDWNECLLWITLVGVWASGEDWPAFYAWRGARSEKRSVEAAPGYLFASNENDLMRDVLTQVMENAWDAFVLPVTDNAAPRVRARISHDEWIEVHGREAVGFGVDIKELRAK